MAENPIKPPLQKMVREFSLPETGSSFFTEVVSKESTRYTSVYPIRRGTLYSTVAGGDDRVNTAHTPLYFLKEIRVGNSDQLVLWVWASDQNAQDASNAAIDYSGESTAHPVYARSYLIRRDVYEAAPTIAYATALTSLIAITVTAGGTGYSASDTVNIAGGGGAAAQLVVDNAGVIQNVIITNDGTGYDSAALPAITITTATGSGATLAAVVQPKAAVLVHQEKKELPHDSPFTSQLNDSVYSSQFVALVRVWEVLPGPWLPFTRYDLLLGPIQGRRRAVLNTGQSASLTATVKTTYEARDGSSVVSWEIEETNSDGTGGAGNPAYPIRIDDTYENERGAVHTVSQIVADVVSAGSLAVAGGTATHIEYKAYNQFLRDKVIETWAIPAVPLPSEELNEDGTITTRTQTMELRTDITEGESVAGGFWTRTTSRAITATISWKIVEVRPLPGNAVVSEELDNDSNKITVTETLKEASTITEQETVSGGTWTKVTSRAVSNLVAVEISRARPLPGNILSGNSYTEIRRGKILETEQKGAVGALDAETGSGVLSSKFEPVSFLAGVRKTSKLDTASFPIGELFIGGYDFVGLPARVPGLTHIGFCSGTTSAFVTTDDAWMSINGTGVPPYSSGSPYTISGATLVRKRVKAASTILCKTRRVVQYLLTHPSDTTPWEVTYTSGVSKVGDIRFSTPNYEMCTVAGNPGTFGINLGPGNLGYVTQNLKFDGKWINVNFNNVLNDAFSIAILLTSSDGTTWTGLPVVAGLGILLTDGVCNFYENYNFAATSPNASDYHASTNPDGFGGRWWFMDKKIEPFGASCWRLETVEFLAPLVGY